MHNHNLDLLLLLLHCQSPYTFALLSRAHVCVRDILHYEQFIWDFINFNIYLYLISLYACVVIVQKWNSQCWKVAPSLYCGCKVKASIGTLHLHYDYIACVLYYSFIIQYIESEKILTHDKRLLYNFTSFSVESAFDRNRVFWFR